MSKGMCQRGATMHQNKVQGDVFQSLLSSHGRSHNSQSGKLTYAASRGAARSPCICMLAMVICNSLVTHTQSIVQMTSMHRHTCCCSLKRCKSCWFARVPAIRQQMFRRRAESANSKRAGCDPEAQQHLCTVDITSLDPHCTTVEPHLIPTSAQTSTK